MSKSYTVKNTNILHNQKTYGAGSTIELTDEAAAKIADYITPIKAKPQSTPPAPAGDKGTTADKNATLTTKKSNKKSDKSANASDASDTSTTTIDTTPTADTDAASSSADSVSAEDAASSADKQETTNDKTVQTSAN